MKAKKDFIELGEWQLNAFKQRDKYKQALEEIRDLFDAIADRKLQTFNEIDTGKILLAIRKRVNEVLK